MENSIKIKSRKIMKKQFFFIMKLVKNFYGIWRISCIPPNFAGQVDQTRKIVFEIRINIPIQ